jgi:hypothetical protein
MSQESSSKTTSSATKVAKASSGRAKKASYRKLTLRSAMDSEDATTDCDADNVKRNKRRTIAPVSLYLSPPDNPTNPQEPTKNIFASASKDNAAENDRCYGYVIQRDDRSPTKEPTPPGNDIDSFTSFSLRSTSHHDYECLLERTPTLQLRILFCCMNWDIESVRIALLEAATRERSRSMLGVMGWMGDG